MVAVSKRFLFWSFFWGLGLFFSNARLYAQVGSWQVYPSLRQTQDMAAAPQHVWVATTGGIYAYHRSSGEIKRYSTIEGLHSSNAKAIAYDAKRQAVWVGYPDGVLDRLNLATGEVSSFWDLARAQQFTDRGINRMRVHGDSLLVATQFGLVVFNPIKNEVTDTYTQFSSQATGSAVSDVMVAPLENGQAGFWVGLELGVAAAPLRGKALRDVSAWAMNTGVPKVLALGRIGNTVFVGTERDAYSLEKEGWIRQGVADGPIRHLVTSPDFSRLGVVSAYWFNLLYQTGTRVQVTAKDYLDLNRGVFAEDGSFWAGDLSNGVAQFSNIPNTGTVGLVPQKQLLPNGPYWQLMADLSLAADGSVWAAPAADLYGGLYKWNGSLWTNYAEATLNGKKAFDRVFVDKKGNVWAASSRSGLGLIMLGNDGKISYFDHQNSSLRAVPNREGDIRIGDFGNEKDGTLWLTNPLATPRLHVRTTDGKWTGLNDFWDQTGQYIRGDFWRLYVDAYGKKWVTLTGDGGLMVLDTKSTPSTTTDDKLRFWSGNRSDGKGLPGAQVRAIAEDRKGGVWIGTNRGLTIFVFGNLATDADPNWPARVNPNTGKNEYVLREVFVNDMVSDAANRMWIASTEGLWVMDAETYEVLAQYKQSNSPLLADNVGALAVDDAKGILYVATDLGLQSVETLALAPAKQIQDLVVYPNPVLGTKNSLPHIYIQGLMDNTELRILNVSGAVIRRFATRGGRATWDGKDEQGNLVPAGVYIVAARTNEGGERAYGKIAIVR